MSTATESRQREELVLSRVIDRLFRKLVKFLMGRITLVKLQEILRLIFIEEAENKLRIDNPTKNVSLTKLALLTGLDTRTVTKIRNSKSYWQPLHRESEYLKDFTFGATLLDCWSSKSPYIDEESGTPKELDISGPSPSFESLFNENTKGRGVTYKSLLNRLVESNSVSIDQKGIKVNLIVKSYLPSVSTDTFGSIEMGFSAIGNMIDTVTRNITSTECDRNPFYQQGAWTFRLDPEDQYSLQSKLRILLEETDSKARKIIEKHEQKSSSPEQITAGVSMFYFEEKNS